MSAYVIFIRDTVTDEAALDRYRQLTPAAREVQSPGIHCVLGRLFLAGGGEGSASLRPFFPKSRGKPRAIALAATVLFWL